MDFNQVRFFLALAETLNFTRAAERCHVTQPALTQAIRRLENELGGELIVRDGRQSQLTELGQELVVHFQQIDRTRRLIRETSRALSEDEDVELNLGLMCTIGPGAVAPMLEAFQMEHPRVSLVLHDISQSSVDDLLLSGALDGAFCAKDSKPNDKLESVPLFDERMVVAFSKGHRFEQADAIGLEAVAEERYVDRLHCEFRPTFLAKVAEQGLSLKVAFRSEREDWIQGLISNGAGVSVLPEFSVIERTLERRPLREPAALSRTILFRRVKGGPFPAALSTLVAWIGAHDW